MCTAMKSAWNDVAMENRVANAFRASGLWPFCPDGVLKSPNFELYRRRQSEKKGGSPFGFVNRDLFPEESVKDIPAAKTVRNPPKRGVSPVVTSNT